MNIDKIKADAEAALPGASPDDQYRADRQHVFNCDPATILKMVAVIEAAKAWRDCGGSEGENINDEALSKIMSALQALETT